MVREKMMRVILYITLLSGSLLTLSAAYAGVEDSLSQRSESAVLEESIATEQARARAQSRSEYGLELRPRVTDSEVGVALRIYLPSRWNKSKLREQLTLVAESEQLRVAALEWQELTQVYRSFCDYRMLERQRVLYEKELESLKPYLDKADLDVKLNQLTVADRARLYSLYLDLVNNHARVMADRLEVDQELRLLLGANANLDQMAESAKVDMPPKASFVSLFNRALENRSDYRLFDARARSLDAAEAVARKEDGFRLKYLQPAYEVDYNSGESTIALSASFILPWGTRNPDIAVFQQERALAHSSMELQRIVIEHRLRVLLKTAEDHFGQAEQRSEAIKPLLRQLYADMELLDTGRLEDLRNLMLIRERILDVSLDSTRTICRKEQIAIELVDELGTMTR
jgi:hypothetical protein